VTGDDEEPENDAPATDDEAPVDNAASRKAYARKVTALEQRQRESQAFWEAVFATPLGRREMWAILDRAHALEDRFACGPNGFPNPESTWFQAGEKAVGLSLYLSWLKLVPNEVTLMLQENYGPLKPPEQPKRRAKKKAD
jgi:hypothetical protein